MLHFIPIWYQGNYFKENEQAWYTRRMQTEFDDTVKQVQLFQRKTEYPYQIILVSFNPNFRHFLHRQGVYHAPYWSCFDAICEIKRTKARTLSIHDLSWPDGIEFQFTPFVMVAKLNGEKYAEVDYGEDGNPIRIKLYSNGSLVRVNNYDDRGFMASTLVYENGVMSYEDFLTEKGNRKFRLFYSDGHVEINPQNPNYIINVNGTEEKHTFSSMQYSSLQQLLQEVLRAYINKLDKDDIFTMAMSDVQADLLSPIIRDRKLILSFFANRINELSIKKYWDIIRDSNYLVTDSKENEQLLKDIFGDRVPNIMAISPYDTRVDLGISQQLNVQKIMVPVDDMAEELLDSLIVILGNYIINNKYARVHLFTRNAEYSREAALLAKVKHILEINNIGTNFVEDENHEELPEFKEENDVESDIVETRFFVDQCVDELSVSRCMREQRLLVDLRNVPELYLQIAAISMGIPQIVMRETQFIVNDKNGKVITSLDQLSEVLTYYLDGLKNWNDAMVESYELGKKYTTGVLLSSWKEVVETIG